MKVEPGQYLTTMEYDNSQWRGVLLVKSKGLRGQFIVSEVTQYVTKGTFALQTNVFVHSVDDFGPYKVNDLEFLVKYGSPKQAYQQMIKTLIEKNKRAVLKHKREIKRLTKLLEE